MERLPAFLPYLDKVVRKKITFAQITPDDGFLISCKQPSLVEVYNDTDGRMLEVFHFMREDPVAFHTFAQHPTSIRGQRRLLRAVQRYLRNRRFLTPLTSERVPKIMSSGAELSRLLHQFASKDVAEFTLRWSFVQLEDTSYDNIIQVYDTDKTVFFAWLHKLNWDVQDIVGRMFLMKGRFLIAHNLTWSSPTRAWELARVCEPEWFDDGWVIFHNMPTRWYS